jgi:predicted restriction endonuclease
MFIHEAACKVLAELGGPAHVRQIHDLIVSKGYYSFGAKNPCNALAIELSRKSINVDMEYSTPDKPFYRAAPATYGLSEWMEINAISADYLASQNVEEDVNSICDLDNFSGTTKRQLILARIGQGAFRKSVLARWNYRCAVTGSGLVIRASHIKPWRECNNIERLDPNNGLPLVATLDALFDSHLITFKPSGVIQMSERIPTFERQCLGIAADMKLRREPTPEMHAYLENHRASLIA